MTPTVQFFDRGRFRLPTVRFAHEERRQLNSWELLHADDATQTAVARVGRRARLR